MTSPLPPGAWPVPAGHLASVVTYLEMRARPPVRPVPTAEPGVTLEHCPAPALTGYRDWFRAVGGDWLWISRLRLSDDALRAILHDPLVEVHVLRRAGQFAGLLELDFRHPGECELAYFGLVPEAVGQGLGRYLMAAAIDKAWSRPIGRFWVHTCTADSQAALPFYIRSGFAPYATAIEVEPDPRLSGLLPRNAAPHVPLIEG